MKQNRLLEYAILSIPFILLFTFLVFPVASVIFQGLVNGPGSSFIDVMKSVVTQRVLSFTFTQALLSTLLALLLGLPGAIVLAKLQFRGKIYLRALLIVPFVLPPIVVVVGFLQMFGNGGIIDSILMFILGSQNSILDIASGYAGIILAHAFYNIPLFLLIVSASLEHLNPEIEEIAEILGATGVQRFRRIIFPHIRSSILAASILTFLFCYMSFPIVLALGEGSYMTVEVQIWNAFRFFDYGEASSLAFIQILVTLFLAYTYTRIGEKESDTPGKTAYVKTVPFSSLDIVRKMLIGIYLGIIFLLSLGPMVSVVRAAVWDPNSSMFSVDGFLNLLDTAPGGGFVPLVNSLFYASLATIFSLILGSILAYAQRSRIRGLPNLTSMMVLLPLGISAITIAYGLMLMIVVPLGLSSNPWPFIVIAQTLIGVPFSARAIEIALSKVDTALIEQAESLGASTIQRLFFVEFPLIAPGLLVGAIFSFAMAIGEMSATIFLATPENFTLAIVIYRDLAVRKFVQAGAASLLLVVICIIAFIIIEKFSQNGYGGAF